MDISKQTIFNTPVLTPILRGISIFILKAFRWKVRGEPPRLAKYVMTAAPHTSNWDFVLVLLMAFVLRVRIYILAKKEMMDWPLGFLFKYAGVIPIDRNQSSNTVEQAVAMMNRSEHMALLISPPGTRKTTNQWKTGFYHIAMLANTPILLGFMDYSRKQGGIGEWFYPTGNVEEDMKAIRLFYSQFKGKYPEGRTTDSGKI
ncbi:MAG: lysophospholipid acyltransferase family protein [Desulfobacteraceae bacterium]|nr:lysophospholipid acyltransferase family protein [Desulfobacteraceae bacterium]